jgi:hypothetical protein
MLAFCRAEYAYYDAIQSDDANHIDPIDVLATVAMNSFVNSATKVRQVHLGMAERCDPLLPGIPEDADLTDLDRWRDVLYALLDAAVQVRGVLVPVATKVLHRKRRRLIPMLDGVILRYLLDTDEHRPLLARTENGATAAQVAMVALDRFHTDLVATSAALERLSSALEEEGFPLSLVRILEVLIWTEVEPGAYYRVPFEPPSSLGG